MDVLTEEVLYKKTSQEITALLYEGIITDLEDSMELIDTKDFYPANRKLQKVNDILHRLGIGIKYEAGPIAVQLDILYNYMADQVIQANIHKDKQIIQHVLQIIAPLAEAWNEAIKKKASNPSIQSKKVSAYEKSVMRINN
jgi:flagellar protein FliS